MTASRKSRHVPWSTEALDQLYPLQSLYAQQSSRHAGTDQLRLGEPGDSIVVRSICSLVPSAFDVCSVNSEGLRAG